MKKLSLLLILLCAALFFSGCDRPPKVAEIGKKVPDFSLVDRKGKTWTLSDLRGKVVFINIWATWCPPCREEMPAIQRLYTIMPEESFQMLTVLNRDDPKNADRLAAIVGLTLPILDDQNDQVGPKFGITGVPETFIVDKQGVLREKVIGGAQWDAPVFQQMLMKYINQ